MRITDETHIHDRPGQLRIMDYELRADVGLRRTAGKFEWEIYGLKLQSAVICTMPGTLAHTEALLQLQRWTAENHARACRRYAATLRRWRPARYRALRAARRSQAQADSLPPPPPRRHGFIEK